MANTPKTIVDVVGAVKDYTAENYTSRQLLKDTVGWTGKNLLPYSLESLKEINTSGTWSGNVYTLNAATFTVNEDLSITVNGTPSAVSNFNIINNTSLTIDQPFIFSGCPSGGSSSSYLQQLYDGSTWTSDYGTERSMPSGTYQRVLIQISANYQVSNKTFYPMLRVASDPDDTYEPYHESVEGYAFPASAQGVLGAKNLLPYPYIQTTKTASGMTYTDVGDGTIIASSNGATTGASDLHMFYFDENTLPKGVYRLSDGGGSTDQIKIYANKHNGRTYISALAYTDESHHDVLMNVDYAGYNEIRVVIYAVSGVTANNIVFKPMIRLASDPDATYAPYAMTNRELTDKKWDKSSQKLAGAYNLWANNVPTQTIGEITFTHNNDGTITISSNGQSIAASRQLYLTYRNGGNLADGLPRIWLQNGTYRAIFNEPIEGQAATRIVFGLFDTDESGAYRTVGSAYAGHDVIFTVNGGYQNFEGTYLGTVITITAGSAIPPITVKPLITMDLNATRNDYVPYAMNNKELTDNLSSSSGIPFKFGIDGNGNYGYIKDGADTVTPFKNPTGTKSDTYTANGTYTPDITDYAIHSVTVNVPASAVVGNAAPGDVLSEKTFSSASYPSGTTGSMTNNGAVSQTLNPGGSYTIPEGYHNGSGVVAASAVTPEIIKFPGDYYGLMHISATASSSNIVDTYSFFGSNNAKYFFIELFVLRDSGGYTDDWNYATNMIDSVTWTNITVLSQAHANTSDVYICKIPDISSTSRIRVVTKTISSPYKGFLVMSGYYLSV